MGGRRGDRRHFEGAIRDRTATYEMISESQNFKIYEGTLSKCWSLSSRVNHLQQCKAM